MGELHDGLLFAVRLAARGWSVVWRGAGVNLKDACRLHVTEKGTLLLPYSPMLSR